MQFGKFAHGFFQKNTQPKGLFDRFVPPEFLRANATVSYYLNDHDFTTNIYLHNYFSLLADSEFAHAKWKVDLHGKDGVHCATRSGVFNGKQSVVVNVSEIPGADKYGVALVTLVFDDVEHVMSRPYSTTYYTEYIHKSAKNRGRAIVHSLGMPESAIYSYERNNYVSGTFMPKSCKPFLLIANGSLLHAGKASQMTGVLDVINQHGETLRIPLPVLAHPLESEMVDLIEVAPTLYEHAHGKPFSLRIAGKNILSKPFWFLIGEQEFYGEHL